MTHPIHFNGPTIGPVGHALHHLTQAVRSEHSRLRTAEELARLDGHLLEDIGINPRDVHGSLRAPRTGSRLGAGFRHLGRALRRAATAARGRAELLRLTPETLRDAGIDPVRVSPVPRDLGAAVREADGLGAPLHPIVGGAEATAQVRGYLSDRPSLRRLHPRVANHNRPAPVAKAA